MLVVQNALRIFFGLLMLTTAVGKLLDNRGFADVLVTYQLGIPEGVLLPLGLAVSLFELALFVYILRGIRLREVAIATIVLHLGYVSLAVLTNLRGLNLENCGCFGVFLARPMTWATVVEDVVLLALSCLFYLSVSRTFVASDTSTLGAAASR